MSNNNCNVVNVPNKKTLDALIEIDNGGGCKFNSLDEMFEMLVEGEDDCNEFIEKITLSEEGTKKLFEAIENPPKPNEKLIEAARNYRKSGGFYVKL